MRTLYLGLSGDDVKAWEYFLLGLSKSGIVVDGKFDQITVDETKKFQQRVGFKGADIDGSVGPKTLGKAMQMGFNPMTDDRVDESSPNWPLKPIGLVQLTSAQREQLFGKFTFVPSPSDANPEGITITDDWAKLNVVTVDIPQLKNITKNTIKFHKLVAPQVKAFFEEVEREGLLDLILTWNGSYVPRYIRGSRERLSNHSWATAFDINVKWNMLGTQGALVGEKGSIRKLIPIAIKHGLYPGIWFANRPDSMHFEIYKIIK